MKIGYDAKRAFCNNTGLGNYSRMLIRGIAELPCNAVTLYTPRIEERHKNYFDDLTNFTIYRPHVLPGSLWRTLLGLRLQHDGIDIYHGLSHELPHGIPQKIKKVVTMHDLIVRRHPEYFKPIDRLIHRLKQHHACRVADVVVAISEQTKRDLIELMGVPEEKIRVVYQSCDPIFWNEELRIKNEELANAVKEKYGLPEKYIICVGTLEERKNQLTVIDAMKRLPNEVGLVLVGRPRGEYGKQVMACASERVRVLTHADFSDFPALYTGAVASVYLSRFEGFGIPVLESMCCYCPVVTSNVSSMPEAGGDAALYAAPDDAAIVATHLRRLLEDDAFRQQCIEKGRTQRMKFAPEMVSQDMLALYKSLLHN